MTGVAELLADCGAQRIRLLPAGGGGLTINAPKGALTPDLLGRLTAHKAEILAILGPKADAHAVAPSNSEAVSQAAADRVDGDPRSPSDGTEAVLAPDRQRADDESPSEPADDSATRVVGPDGWPVDSIDPDELTPCPTCRTLELWENLEGDWRCMRCDPPITSRRVQELAERIRRRTNRTNDTRHKG
jgi:hypothetical protein